MAKIKLKIVCEVEYELQPSYYPDGSTLEQMLKIDLEGAIDDPFLTMDNENANWTITGELL